MIKSDHINSIVGQYRIESDWYMRSTIKVAHAAAGGGRRRISIFGFKIFI